MNGIITQRKDILEYRNLVLKKPFFPLNMLFIQYCKIEYPQKGHYEGRRDLKKKKTQFTLQIYHMSTL